MLHKQISRRVLSLFVMLITCTMMWAQASGTSGTCEWTVDDNGLLTIQPIDGVSGTLEDWGDTPPWYDLRENIVKAKIEPGVSATTCYNMFYECEALVSIEGLSNLNTQNVTSMSWMFGKCSSLTSLDVSSFDTHNVTDMSRMFSQCSALTSLDVSGFDTRNVKNMSSMFYRCSTLENLDVSSFDTQNVTDMNAMFNRCSALKSLDLSNFDTQNVTNMDYMFTLCSALESIDVSSFDTHNVSGMAQLFSHCTALESLDLSNFDTHNVTDMNAMFNACSSLTSLNLSNFNTQNVTNMDYMFVLCSALESLDVSSFDTHNVSGMAQLFTGCSALKSLDLSNFDTQNVTNMDYMFVQCSALESLDVSSFDTHNVSGMAQLFSGCSALKSLDLSNLDTHNITDMSYMFNRCSALESLDLSNFDTHNVTDMTAMFNACSSLTSLNLSGFNTQNVTDMDYMLTACPSLNTIYSLVETPSILKVGTFDSFEGRAACRLIVPAGSEAAYAAADGWKELGGIDELLAQGTSGTCEWMLDSDGLLTIQPIDGVSGTLEDWGNWHAPWYEHQGSIMKVKIEPGVSASTCRLMFDGCSNLISIEGLNNLNTQNATSMRLMFYECSALESLDLSNFDTHNVTDMNAMFFGCSALESIDLSSFNTSNVTETGCIFGGCSSLHEIHWGQFAITNEMLGNDLPVNLLIYAPEGTASEREHNVVYGGKCESLMLTEGEPLIISEEFESKKAVLTRTFEKPSIIGRSSAWESLVLPYDVTYITTEDGRLLAPFNSGVEGSYPFWLAEMTQGGDFAYSTELKANTPYIIAMPNNEMYDPEFNVEGRVQFIGENVTVRKTGDAQSVEGESMRVVPTYMEVCPEDADLYVLNREATVNSEMEEMPAGSVFEHSDGTVALPFEMYVLQQSPVKGQRFLPLNINGVANQIEGLYANTYGQLDIHAEDHQLVITARKAQTISVYDMRGISVCTLQLQPGINRTPALPTGIYIIGKEKYMVR